MNLADDGYVFIREDGVIESRNELHDVIDFVKVRAEDLALLICFDYALSPSCHFQ